MNQILGRWRSFLYYIDGFAGPGGYKDDKTSTVKPGSPVIAIKAYLEYREKGGQYEMRFINVEKKERNFRELEDSTSDYKLHLDIENLHGEFLDNIDHILEKTQNAFAFFFIDPFGISGIDFAELEKVFAREDTEILLNFNYDGLQRCLGELTNFDDPDARKRTKAVKTIERVCSMFDVTKAELEDILMLGEISQDKEILLLRNYVGKLRNYKPFVYPLPIRFPGQERTFYYLVFLTQNIIALKIMKDVMMKAKKMEEGRQLFLPLPDIDVERLKAALYQEYKGRMVERKEIYTDWLPKVFILDGEDYLARHIDNALNSLAKAEDMPVTKIPGKKIWNPYYRFD